jgi:hypothetical protein
MPEHADLLSLVAVCFDSAALRGGPGAADAQDRARGAFAVLAITSAALAVVGTPIAEIDGHANSRDAAESAVGATRVAG